MSAPVNTTPPVISGGNIIGNTLTVSDGIWSNEFRNTITYQWYRGGVAINGATTNTYTLVEVDVGYAITCEVVNTNLTNEASSVLVNTLAYNTPAPVIVDQDDDDNIFSWTAVGGVELSTDNGVSWSDQTSPYNVGMVDIPLGYLQIRVKADNVNPESEITPSTIAWTAQNQVDYTTVEVYAQDLGGIDTSEIEVHLSDGIFKYKNNVYIRSQKVVYTPDAVTGLITMNLPDTDNMEGKAYYHFNFNNGVKYRAKVPATTDTLNFWDLDPERNNNKEFLHLG
jgi:hypothetical protein